MAFPEILRLVDEVPGEILPPLLGKHLYVDPAGSDSNDGSADSPLRTIQAALDKATPGTQINLAPGEYRELPLTKVAGLSDAPITIQGPEMGMNADGRSKAVLYVPKGRGFRIDHSYYTLTGFTINGQEQLGRSAFRRSFIGSTGHSESSTSLRAGTGP